MSNIGATYNKQPYERYVVSYNGHHDVAESVKPHVKDLIVIQSLRAPMLLIDAQSSQIDYIINMHGVYRINKI